VRDDLAMEFDVPADRLINGSIAFFTFTSNEFAPFVMNLHASIKRFDPPLADKLIVFCADEEGAARLQLAGMFAVPCGPICLPESVELWSEGFGRVVSHKFALARSLLRQAEYAWWCDGDVVVRGPVSERIPALLAGSDADLLMQYEWPKDVFNTGFWIARRSPAVDAMLADVAEKTGRDDVEDQTYFNERHAHAGAISIATLDPDEFMCGNRFFYRGLRAQPQGLVLHFNYCVGTELKRTRMMEHGAWYLPHTRLAAWRARMRYLSVRVRQRLRR
jgi:Nucleotide-diphospho-sugar transferase